MTVPGNMCDSGHRERGCLVRSREAWSAGALGQIGKGRGVGGVCRGLTEEVMLELVRNHVLGSKVEKGVQARERNVCKGTPFNVFK